MKIKIALAQVSVLSDTEDNIRKGLSFLEKASGSGADLICFPEMSFCHFFAQHHAESKYYDLAESIPGPLTERFREACLKNNIAAIINMYEKYYKKIVEVIHRPLLFHILQKT